MPLQDARALLVRPSETTGRTARSNRKRSRLRDVQELHDENFKAEVLDADGPVVVDFWAPWCGPCHAVEPILRQLEEAHGNVKFAKLDVDQNISTASRYEVLSIPTAILFEDGEPKEAVIGARPRSFYEEAWADWLS
jgi:thioredoxin 1